ncbi:hypothetical protein VOLCADRAFT_98460 [Volvox carteri f. nagariensis]|uniref:Pherophorin domain-containing protein n=1 Tax=Volvox carteri f. nagariensis TaxID=3068 RepID=D8UFE2_VOLCA|nr:uncharacterized protein VOLCADRAFT_98460 [Volvox carteri f. nagariensis]EFJ41595.1 hypothetical protein VOLCADRAFT_98460 [Volvox carteri f. nagariensis]|eukprot:XP_002957386.1 hypothetical protein VOLCADRAFT_98460 [Volvox carteri f. nagariensis]
MASCNHMERLAIHSLYKVAILGLICAVVVSGEDAVSSKWISRNLLTKSTLSNYPYCKCETYSCRSSPYTMSYVGAYPAAAGTKHCFAVGYVGCTAANSTCCEALNRNVYKMSIAIGASCVKPAMSQVEINGRSWPTWSTVSNKRGTDDQGAVVYGYDVRIYNMQFNMTTFPGSTVCITTTEPCSGIQQLCDSTAGTCNQIPDRVISNLTDALNAAGVAIREVFVKRKCTENYNPEEPNEPQLLVCGSFDVPNDLAAFQELLSGLTAGWVSSVAGVPVVPGINNDTSCPTGKEGYGFDGTVFSTADSAQCPFAFSEKNCTERYAPFPSPPLPPPGSPIRYVKTHNCSQAASQVPYLLTPVESYNTTYGRGEQVVAMCTTLQNAGMTCGRKSRCCGMDAAKVEVIMKPSCQGALRSITVNGKEIAYSRSFYPDFTSLKFVKLPTLGDPDGMRLCWYASPGPCGTPRGFCYNGRCQASIFSLDNKCCPTFII